MGCLVTEVRRIGGITVSAKRVGCGLGCTLTSVGGIDFCAERIGGISVRTASAGGINCRMVLVCDVNVPYLEIEPEMIWVNPWGTNEVLSNTHWTIETQ